MKKKTEEPAKFPENTLGLIQTDMGKWLFNYLKENLTIDVDCYENWGYYENGEVSVAVNLYLTNPETGNKELIGSSTGTAR